MVTVILCQLNLLKEHNAGVNQTMRFGLMAPATDYTHKVPVMLKNCLLHLLDVYLFHVVVPGFISQTRSVAIKSVRKVLVKQVKW